MRTARLIPLVMLLVLVGCQQEDAKSDSNRPEAPKPEDAAPIRVHKDVTGQLYRYFPSDGGKPKSSTTIDGVPASARDMVMVVPAAADPPPGLVYMADLSQEGPDGTYSYKVVSNAALDTALTESRGALKAVAAAAPSRLRAPASARAASGKNDIIIFSTSWCGVCGKARRWFRNKGIQYVERDIEKDPGAREDMQKRAVQAGLPASQLGGVPVIWVNGQMFPGFDPGRISGALRS